MIIAYNPTGGSALSKSQIDSLKNDIIFDLSGMAVYARGIPVGKVYQPFEKSTSSTTEGYNGLVPFPDYNGNSKTRFLREDGTWVVPTNTNNYRPISVNGTSILENNNTALNLVAGTNITLSPKKDSNNKYTGEVTITASNPAWDNITGKPTTLAGYGITDAVKIATKSANVSESCVGYTTAGHNLQNGGLFTGLGADGNYGSQLLGNYVGTGLYYRGKNNGTWTAWKTVAFTSDMPAVYFKRITSGFKDEFRTQTKGDGSNGDYIAAIRCNASVEYAPLDSSGIAFGVGDTHGYLYTSYSSALAYIGGGNANKLKWVKQIAFRETTLSGYGITDAVTLNTQQTITGLKTFESNSSTTGVSLILKNKGWTGGMSTAMDFYNGSPYTVPNARIETKMVGNGSSGGTLIFYTQTKHASTNPNPNGLTERLRIDDNGLITITGNLTVTGTSNFSAGTVKLDVLNIPTSSGGTTFGPGSNGQVLKSNGTTVYWASDNNSYGYIGTTAVQSSSKAQSLTGITNITTSGIIYTNTIKFTNLNADQFDAISFNDNSICIGIKSNSNITDCDFYEGGIKINSGYYNTEVSCNSFIVNSSITASGEITAYSDRRLKSNIKPLENRGYIQPMTYIKDNKECIGFIAQDVQEKYPELVNDNSEYLSLNYQQYVAVLQAQIIELEKRIKELENGTRKQ